MIQVYKINTELPLQCIKLKMVKYQMNSGFMIDFLDVNQKYYRHNQKDSS